VGWGVTVARASKQAGSSFLKKNQKTFVFRRIGGDDEATTGTGWLSPSLSATVFGTSL
jgi:hypothetical protein